MFICNLLFGIKFISLGQKFTARGTPGVLVNFDSEESLTAALAQIKRHPIVINGIVLKYGFKFNALKKVPDPSKSKSKSADG